MNKKSLIVKNSLLRKQAQRRKCTNAQAKISCPKKYSIKFCGETYLSNGSVSLQRSEEKKKGYRLLHLKNSASTGQKEYGF